MSAKHLGFSLLLVALWLGLWAGCAHIQPAAPAEKPAAAEVPKPVALPTLFIVGDSTVHNSGKILGWGDVIGEQFDTSRIKVINCARGGRSTRSFRNEGLWAKVLAQAKPGDFVFIQFGHNDSAALSDKAKVGRGTLPGTGPETAETSNTADGKSETVHTYGWYLARYVTEAKAKGMTVVIFSPVPRNTWNTDGTFKHVMAVYTPWAAQVAKEQGARFVDLESIVSAHYVQLGREKTKDFFPQDYTHTSPEGATLNADCVIEGLKTLKDFPLNDDLKRLPKRDAAKNAGHFGGGRARIAGDEPCSAFVDVRACDSSQGGIVASAHARGGALVYAGAFCGRIRFPLRLRRRVSAVLREPLAQPAG